MMGRNLFIYYFACVCMLMRYKKMPNYAFAVSSWAKLSQLLLKSFEAKGGALKLHEEG